MSLAFFGKGVGALGWAVMADVAPKRSDRPRRRPVQHLRQPRRHRHADRHRLHPAERTGSFEGALVYVGAHALLAVVSFLVIVGDIRRIELPPAGGVPVAVPATR